MRVLLSKRKKARRILVFGAFDILHPGHRSLFRQAKKLGTELVVAVGRDHIVRRVKKRATYHPEKTRLAHVAAEPLVDRAVLAPPDPRRRFHFIRSLKPDVIALGYDQTHYTRNLRTDLLKHGVDAVIVRLRAFRPHLYKGSIIRRKKSGRK